SRPQAKPVGSPPKAEPGDDPPHIVDCLRCPLWYYRLACRPYGAENLAVDAGQNSVTGGTGWRHAVASGGNPGGRHERPTVDGQAVRLPVCCSPEVFIPLTPP